MRRELLDRLLEARAAKRPAAHLRWLAHGDEALVVAGEVVLGAAPRLIDYGVSNEQAWEVGLACGGKLEVYIEAVA